MSSISFSKSGYGTDYFRHDKETKLHKSICINHGLQLTDIKLGCGSYSTVRLGVKISANINAHSKKVAIKIVSKSKAFQDGNKGFLLNEIFNHRIASRHRNVVTLFDVFETNSYLYLVLEYCSGGNLLDFINKHGKPGLRESQSRLMFSQLCHAVAFCHENNIVHRDIKCENVLLDDRLAVRLIDFGFSCMVTENQRDLGMFCGSPAYAAPEIIRGKPYNGKMADIWSLGIVLYCKVCGRLPFNLKNKTLLLQDMQYQRMRMTSLSSELVLLLRQMLQYDPDRRPTLKAVLENTWTQGKRMHPGTSLHQSEILNRKLNNIRKSRCLKNAVTSQSFTHEINSEKSKKSTVVVGDSTGSEAIVLRSRLPKKQEKLLEHSTHIQQHQQKHLKYQPEEQQKEIDGDDSSDSASRPHQNTPEDEVSNGENEQGDHHRESDKATMYCQCCVVCYRDRVRHCLRNLETHLKKYPECDDSTVAKLLREYWNREPDFGLMTQEQALLILVAWKRQLSKENALPVLRFTKKNKTGVAPKIRYHVKVPSSGVSVHSGDTECTDSTKITQRSEKFPLDDLLLIKKVFGNGIGVPCNKRPVSAKGLVTDCTVKGSVAESVASTRLTVGGHRGSTYTTRWEVRQPKKASVQNKKPSIPSQFGNRGQNQKKVSLMPTVKQLLCSGDSTTGDVNSAYPTSISQLARYEMLKFPMESRIKMTTKDLITALGSTYPRKPKTIDIGIRPWKP